MFSSYYLIILIDTLTLHKDEDVGSYKTQADFDAYVRHLEKVNNKFSFGVAQANY